MGFGGIIAGALGQGAQAVGDIAQQQIDVNNKQQLASFQSGLEADRNAQQARLAQTIGQENTMYGLSAPVQAATNAASAGKISSDAAAHADPTVLSNEDIAEAHRPFNLHPGEQHFAGGEPGAPLTPIANNSNLTGADARYQIALQGLNGKGAGADAKAQKYTADEENKASTALSADLEKTFKDPTTGATNPVAMVAGKTAYIAALNSGGLPPDASAAGLSAANKAVSLVQAARRDYPDQTKGKSDYEVFQVIDAARNPPPAAADAKPTPIPAAAPAPAKDPSGIIGTPAPPAPDDTPQAGILGGSMNRKYGGAPGPRSAPTGVPDAQKTADAASAFATLKPGDVRAASDLQGSPLFDFLTTAQQRAIAKTVNGR